MRYRKSKGPPEISEKARSTSMGRQKLYQKLILVRLTEDEYRHVRERAKQSRGSLSRVLVESTLADEAVTGEKKECTERLIEQRDLSPKETTTAERD